MRSAPLYTLARPSRTKPARVISVELRARGLTARLVGAETEETIGMRATALFSKIS